MAPTSLSTCCKRIAVLMIFLKHLQALSLSLPLVLHPASSSRLATWSAARRATVTGGANRGGTARMFLEKLSSVGSRQKVC